MKKEKATVSYNDGKYRISTNNEPMSWWEFLQLHRKMARLIVEEIARANNECEGNIPIDEQYTEWMAAKEEAQSVAIARAVDMAEFFLGGPAEGDVLNVFQTIATVAFSLGWDNGYDYKLIKKVENESKNQETK